ncbi:hypothetical protein D3C72_1240500 [compost metagenome]
MVEHPHGKHRVETFEVGRQVFQGEWQVPGGQLWQVLLNGLELAEEQPVGIDANHHVGAGTEHAPLVVAIAAAHVEHALALEVQVRADPGPFPVRTPFGVHMHAEQVEWPFAPRGQAHQCLAHLHAGGVVAIAVQAQPVDQVDFARIQGGQGFQRTAPAVEVTVTLLQLGFQLRLQALRPGSQGRARQTADEGGQIDHGRAIKEAKLRHWNQGTTFEKPAARRRAWWASRVSGLITFSMALRFWAISSSL